MTGHERRRLWLGFVVAFATGLVVWGGLLVAVGRADSLVYTRGGDVVFENGDGTQRRAVTADASGPGGVSYVAPSLNDAGDIAVLRVGGAHAQPTIDLRPVGGALVRSPLPWVPSVSPDENGAPYTARLLPESTSRLLAYTYGRNGHAYRGFVTPADAPGSPVLGEDTVEQAGWSGVTAFGDGLVVTLAGALTFGDRVPETSWLRTRDANRSIVAGELSREAAGRRLLVRVAEEGTGDRLGVFAVSGAVPQAVTIGDGCWMPHAGTLRGAAISPDGTRIAWADGTGLRLARVTVPAGEADTCALSGARVLAADGDAPAFSRYTQAPSAEDPPPPDRTTTTDPPLPPPTTQPPVPTTTVPRTTTVAVVPPAITLTVGRRATARQLRRGIAMRVRASRAGRVVLTLRRARTTVATRAATVPAGTRRTLTLKLGRRATVRRGQRLVLTATLTASGGGRASTTARVTVR